jgi:hypothetical protein
MPFSWASLNASLICLAIRKTSSRGRGPFGASPSTYSITRKLGPTSKRPQILGWFSDAIARASRSKRSVNCWFEVLMATSRPKRVSLAK